MNLTYLIAFATALVATLFSTPVARRLALRLNVVDAPTARKLHTDPVPYLGGVAIIVAFCFAVVGGALASGVKGSAYLPMAALLGGALVMAAMGLWDDLRVVPGWIKVPMELGLGTVLYFAGWQAHLFGWAPANFIITLAWVIGIVNAVNYMDNMDGLTAGMVGIAASYFTVLAALNGQILVASLSAALTGCALGFLWHNRPPARIFMGDAGSLFFGVLLAGLGLDLRFDNIARVTFFVPVAIMAVPILDALMVSVSRVKRGLSPIHPGKDHVSHRLLKFTVSPKGVLALLWFAAAACGWLGVTIAYSRPLTAYMLMGWMIVVALFLGWLLMRVDI